MKPLTGYQVREVWCALRHDASRASNELCDPTTVPASIERCSLTSCPPKWTTSDWSSCSVTCSGNGTKSRQVFVYINLYYVLNSVCLYTL